MNFPDEILLYGGMNNLRELVMSKRRGRCALAVRAAIIEGRLPPAKSVKCVDCGQPATCYDHRDYSKPLDVDAVCKPCDGKRGPGMPYWDEDSSDPEYIDLVVTVMLHRLQLFRRKKLLRAQALAKAYAKAPE